MGILGVAAGPDVIADEDNPSQTVNVDQYGFVGTVEQGIDPSGTYHTQRVTAGGQAMQGDAEIMLAILTELRTLNAMIAAIGAGQSTTGNPDHFRVDVDATAEFGGLLS